MTDGDGLSAGDHHPHEGRECPYCDGKLTQIRDWQNPLQCTGDDCPATFVAVFGGGSHA